LDDYYNNLHGYIHDNQCYYHFEKTRINPYGDVIPCVGGSVGNVTKTNITEIVNNESYKKFRRTIKKIGTFPSCRRCCKL